MNEKSISRPFCTPFGQQKGFAEGDSLVAVSYTHLDVYKRQDRSQTTVTVPNLISTEWSNAQVQLNIKDVYKRQTVCRPAAAAGHHGQGHPRRDL